MVWVAVWISFICYLPHCKVGGIRITWLTSKTFKAVLDMYFVNMVNPQHSANYCEMASEWPNTLTSC